MSRRDRPISRAQTAFESLLLPDEEDDAAWARLQRGSSSGRSRGTGRSDRGRFALRTSPPGPTPSTSALDALIERTAAPRELAADCYAACGHDLTAASAALAAMGFGGGGGQPVQAAGQPPPPPRPAVGATPPRPPPPRPVHTIWDDLPIDCQREVWARLSLRDAAAAARVCRAFASSSRTARSAVRTLDPPAGLSVRALAGMVAAHPGATAVNLARWGDRLDEEAGGPGAAAVAAALAAGVEGRFDAWRRAQAAGGDRPTTSADDAWNLARTPAPAGGLPPPLPITRLDLPSSDKLVERGVGAFLRELPSLTAVTAVRCGGLNDAAAAALGRYRRQVPVAAAAFEGGGEEEIGGEEEAGGGAGGQPAAAAHPRTAAAIVRRATAAAAGSAAPPPPPDASLAAPGGLAAAPSRAPSGPCGGLAHVALVACPGVTDAGLSSLLRGPAARASLAWLDMSRSNNITCVGLSGPRAPNLTALRAHNCSGLAGALALDASSLPSLQSLSLAGCARLTSLRLGPLPRLTTLNVAGCKALTALGLGGVPALASLSASGCASLATLWPPGEGRGLADLNLFGCRSLTAPALEGGLAGAGGLVRLTLNGCTALSRVRLPPHATSLTEVDGAGCGSAVELDAGGAPSLTFLRLDGCRALSRIRLAPGTRLRQLSVSGCEALAPEWGALARSL